MLDEQRNHPCWHEQRTADSLGQLMNIRDHSQDTSLCRVCVWIKKLEVSLREHSRCTFFLYKHSRLVEFDLTSPCSYCGSMYVNCSILIHALSHMIFSVLMQCYKIQWKFVWWQHDHTRTC
jgi:hypothetical protein